MHFFRVHSSSLGLVVWNVSHLLVIPLSLVPVGYELWITRLLLLISINEQLNMLLKWSVNFVLRVLFLLLWFLWCFFSTAMLFFEVASIISVLFLHHICPPSGLHNGFDGSCPILLGLIEIFPCGMLLWWLAITWHLSFAWVYLPLLVCCLFWSTRRLTLGPDVFIVSYPHHVSLCS